MNYKQLFFVISISFASSLFPKVDPDQIGLQFQKKGNEKARFIFVNDTDEPIWISYKTDIKNIEGRKGKSIKPHDQWIMTSLGKSDIWENPRIIIQIDDKQEFVGFPLFKELDSLLPLFTSEAFGRTLEDIEKDHVIRMVIVTEKNTEGKPVLVWYYMHPSSEFVKGGEIKFEKTTFDEIQKKMIEEFKKFKNIKKIKKI